MAPSGGRNCVAGTSESVSTQVVGGRCSWGQLWLGSLTDCVAPHLGRRWAWHVGCSWRCACRVCMAYTLLYRRTGRRVGGRLTGDGPLSDFGSWFAENRRRFRRLCDLPQLLRCLFVTGRGVACVEVLVRRRQLLGFLAKAERSFALPPCVGMALGARLGGRYWLYSRRLVEDYFHWVVKVRATCLEQRKLASAVARALSQQNRGSSR